MRIFVIKSLKLTSNCSAGRKCLQCTAKVCCAFCWLLNLRRKQIQALIECEFRISGHIQKSEDFEKEKLTTYNISTVCFKAVVVGLWPVWLFIVARGQKWKQ